MNLRDLLGLFGCAPPAALFATLMCLLLAACGDPPCASAEGAEKAAQAFKACVSINQHGEGGISCGTLAYDTYCRKGSSR